MKTETCENIATDFDLWGEYIDPHATMTEEDFDNLSLEAKLKIIHDTFPSECDCEK